MAELFLDDLGMHARFKRQRRHRVAEVVEAGPRHACRGTRPPEHRQVAVWVVRATGLIDEHVAGVRPRLAERETLAPLQRAVLAQGHDRRRCEQDLSLALGLRRRDDELMVRLRHLLGDRERA